MRSSLPPTIISFKYLTTATSLAIFWKQLILICYKFSSLGFDAENRNINYFFVSLYWLYWSSMITCSFCFSTNIFSYFMSLFPIFYDIVILSITILVFLNFDFSMGKSKIMLFFTLHKFCQVSLYQFILWFSFLKWLIFSIKRSVQIWDVLYLIYVGYNIFQEYFVVFYL